MNGRLISKYNSECYQLCFYYFYYDETDKKETEAPPAAEPKKEDPEEVVSDGIKGKILDKTRRGWNVKDIAEYCKCSGQTVRNWQKRFKEEGMLDMTL